MNIQLTDQTLVRQIGQIAHQTWQTPEELVTRAMELYVRQLSAENLPEKEESAAREPETGPMTLEAIMDKTRSILRDLADRSDTIMAELEPVRRSGMLEVMNRLARRIAQAENAHDLVTIANIVHDLTVEVPRFPPDDEPREQHFRLKPTHDGNGHQRHVRHQKMALQDMFNSSFERIEQAWRNTPSLIPPHVSKGSKETPWDLMGIFKDDPTWGEMFDEIERERDKDSVWLGGESE